MMMLNALLVAALCQTGELKITIDGTPGAIDVFPADPLTDAALLSKHGASGFFMDPFDSKAEVEQKKLDKGVSLKAKPGTYHVRIRTDGRGSMDASSAVWLTNQKIEAGKTTEASVKLAAPGSVKGTWTVDKSIQEGTKMVATSAALVRDGKVWAFAKSDVAGKYEIKGAAPGAYTLVVSDIFENFLAIKENVTVAEGKEVEASIEVKRASLGGVKATFVDKSGKACDAPEGLLLVDEKNRFAVTPNMSGSGGDGAYQGWSHLPSGGSYVILAKGLEKKGVTLKAPVVTGEGMFAKETYPLLKVERK